MLSYKKKYQKKIRSILFLVLVTTVLDSVSSGSMLQGLANQSSNASSLDAQTTANASIDFDCSQTLNNPLMRSFVQKESDRNTGSDLCFRYKKKQRKQSISSTKKNLVQGRQNHLAFGQNNEVDQKYEEKYEEKPAELGTAKPNSRFTHAGLAAPDLVVPVFSEEVSVVDRAGDNAAGFCNLVTKNLDKDRIQTTRSLVKPGKNLHPGAQFSGQVKNCTKNNAPKVALSGVKKNTRSSGRDGWLYAGPKPCMPGPGYYALPPLERTKPSSPAYSFPKASTGRLSSSKNNDGPNGRESKPSGVQVSPVFRKKNISKKSKYLINNNQKIILNVLKKKSIQEAVYSQKKKLVDIGPVGSYPEDLLSSQDQKIQRKMLGSFDKLVSDAGASGVKTFDQSDDEDAKSIDFLAMLSEEKRKNNDFLFKWIVLIDGNIESIACLYQEIEMVLLDRPPLEELSLALKVPIGPKAE
jgi:hypothetical protein